MSPSVRQRFSSTNLSVAFLLFLLAEPIRRFSPGAALWTTPSIVLASLLIAWGAESAQFFVAQGFALAILAWMQTLPEFAVEAVLAHKQQTPLLMANLTGALRLLTGLAWPMIYFTAALQHRRVHDAPMLRISLPPQDSVTVIALIPPILYGLFIWSKGRLEIYDAVILTAIYVAYLWLLTRLPPAEKEGIDDLQRIPRAIVTAKPRPRNLAIAACFIGGGGLIYFTAEPFLGSLIAVATAVGVPTFIVIQWLAPVISEFPELASTFYFARQEGKAAMALMNIASSNINQWTLLVAMLPVVLSLGHGSPIALFLSQEQRSELLLTVAQSFLSIVFVLKLAFLWWEALALFVLFIAQFILPRFLGSFAQQDIAIFIFIAAVLIILKDVVKWHKPAAFRAFAETWHAHV